MRYIYLLLSLLGWMVSVSPVHAHHVLGRPAYSLNEDSNTPPSMQVETRIGNYFVTYMVFPAFPKPGKPGRLNLYAVHIDTNEPYEGEVTFDISDDDWFSNNNETIGTQKIDDGVYRQGFVVNETGDYIITARFSAQNEPYVIEFPLRVGVPSQLTLPTIIVGVTFLVLIGISLIQRKRLMQQRIRDTPAQRSAA